MDPGRPSKALAKREASAAIPAARRAIAHGHRRPAMKQSISTGDVVVLKDGRRGQVTLAAQNGALLRVRLNNTPAGTQVTCEAREAWLISSWWNSEEMRAAFSSGRRQRRRTHLTRGAGHNGPRRPARRDA